MSSTQATGGQVSIAHKCLTTDLQSRSQWCTDGINDCAIRVLSAILYYHYYTNTLSNKSGGTILIYH